MLIARGELVRVDMYISLPTLRHFVVDDPVHAEEMYDPDVFGKGLPATLVVGEE